MAAITATTAARVSNSVPFTLNALAVLCAAARESPQAAAGTMS
jgi:hypothetical protein